MRKVIGGAHLFKRPSPEFSVVPNKERKIFFCMRCEAEDFKLYQDGGVHCSDCGALMRNVFVKGK